MKTIALLVASSLVLAGCGNSTADNNKDSLKELEVATKKMNQCYYKGIQYFKDIGSYPYLTTGEHADSVVERRCFRSVNAF
jgi:protein involved in sex pheromone biosynthesis